MTRRRVKEAPLSIARNVKIIALAGVMSAGMLSAASAADRARPVIVTRPVAPAVVQAAPHLHPVLWCVGGVIVSVVIHNPIPAAVGCAITVVHVHRGYYY
jgi:ABC-type glucose/galactose transport system permease subunit